jgi:hypothetical protein
MKPEREYPFVPKSSTRLTPGDFWAVPLRDGTFACGRVVERMPTGKPGARVGFLGGLLDWRDSSKPDDQSIAGASFLAQGVVHIRAITSSGGSILGHRDLALDELGPWTFVYGATIQRGFTFLRAWQGSDAGKFPSLGWWGYDIMQARANLYFIEGRTEWMPPRAA